MVGNSTEWKETLAQGNMSGSDIKQSEESSYFPRRETSTWIFLANLTRFPPPSADLPFASFARVSRLLSPPPTLSSGAPLEIWQPHNSRIYVLRLVSHSAILDYSFISRYTTLPCICEESEIFRTGNSQLSFWPISKRINLNRFSSVFSGVSF